VKSENYRRFLIQLPCSLSGGLAAAVRLLLINPCLIFSLLSALLNRASCCGGGVLGGLGVVDTDSCLAGAPLPLGVGLMPAGLAAGLAGLLEASALAGLAAGLAGLLGGPGDPLPALALALPALAAGLEAAPLLGVPDLAALPPPAGVADLTYELVVLL